MIDSCNTFGPNLSPCLHWQLLFVFQLSLFSCHIKSFFLPAATKLGQGNIFTGVCLSTGGAWGGWGEGCLPQCMLGYPLLEQTPPQEQTLPLPPLEQTPPEQTPPGSRPPQEQTPPPGADHPPGTRHTPPGSRLQHTVNERPVRILLECILVW